MRRITLGVAAVLLTACSTGSPISSSPTQTATGTPSPTATETPTIEPTAVPTTAPEGKIEKLRELVIAWQPQYSTYVSFQVIVELKNTGTGWAQIHPGQSDYTVLNKAGDVVTTGSFTYAYPEFVAPGAIAFLAEDSSDSSSKVADYAKVDTTGRFDAVDPPDATFTFSSIRLKSDQFGGGLTATGFVTATSIVTSASLGVVCLNSNGVPLGITTTNLLQNLSAGQKKGFETVTNTPPLRSSQCVKLFEGASKEGF